MAKDDPNGRQGRRNQEMRDLRNRIHDLETREEQYQIRNRALETAVSDLSRGMDLFMDPPKAALTKICSLPAIEAVRAGVGAEVLALSEWFNNVLLASGKYELGRMIAQADTPDEIRERMENLRKAMR